MLFYTSKVYTNKMVLCILKYTQQITEYNPTI